MDEGIFEGGEEVDGVWEGTNDGSEDGGEDSDGPWDS
jgi:hypothetical protein